MRFLKQCKSIFTLCILFILANTIIHPALAGTLLVAKTLSNKIAFIDDKDYSTITEVTVGYMPHEVAVTPNGEYALVSNFGDLANIIAGSTLSVIDIQNAKVINKIQLPKRSRPHGIHFLCNKKALVTAQGIQSLLLVDIATGRLVKSLALPGAGAHMIAVDSSKRYAYISNTDSGTLTKVDLKAWAVVQETKIGKQSEGITLSKDENLVFATDSKDNYVAVLRTKDLGMLKAIPTDLGPVRVVLAQNGQFAAVINSISSTVQMIDTANLTVVRKFESTISHALLKAPANIMVRKDQKTAYISNFLANNVALVDLEYGLVITTIKTYFLPNGMAYSPLKTTVTQNAAIVELSTGPIEINASPEIVWEVMKNVEDYQCLSHGAITAHVDGDIAIGKTITLTLYKGQLRGAFIPPSNEIVTVMDADQKVLGWNRELPLGAGHTERYQVLEKTADNKTMSTIVLRVPGVIGNLTNLLYKKTILDSFKALNEGIKNEAEQRAVKVRA